jgi:hypothetical protein
VGGSWPFCVPGGIFRENKNAALISGPSVAQAATKRAFDSRRRKQRGVAGAAYSIRHTGRNEENGGNRSL